MAKQTGTDLDDVSGGGNNKRPRIDETIAVFKFPPKKWVTLRIFGPIFTYGGYWVTTKTKDGKKTKFYTPCPSYDPATQQRDSTIYDPWRDLEAKQADMERDDKTLNFSKAGFTNAIFRKAQKDAPRKLAKHTKHERKTGFKEKDSDSFTPVVALRLPGGAITKLKEQAGLNVVEVKGQTKSFPITHPKYGCDVRIMHSPEKAPADQYQVSIGERTKLTEEEEAYLKWDLSDLESAPDEKEVKRDFESWASRNGIKVGGKKKKAKDEDDEDLDDDDGEDGEDGEDDDEPKSKSKKSKSKSKDKKKKSKDEDEDDDEDLDDDDEDDEPKSKKSKGKKKAKDDEDDDFGDDDDDDDDDEPKSKKKAGKGKKKSKDEDDDDDDDDEDGDEDEDDEPKSKKSKVKAKGKKKSKDEDEDDEDDFGDDDEDDEPKSKKSKSSKKSKKSKDEDDEDEDEDDEDLDEDDEDEEPKSKKSKVKSKGKKAKDEDDDDDDDDFDEDDEDEDEEPKKKVKAKSKKSKR